MKLGIKGPKSDRHGRTLSLGDILQSKPPSYPEAFDPWPQGVPPDTDPLENISYGCCLPAGLGHSIILDDAIVGRPTSVTGSGVLEAYTGITTAEGLMPFDPANPDTDQGCYGLDGMKYFRSTGVCGQKIDAFALVNPLDRTARVQAMFFLNLGLCFQLPKYVQGKDTWDVQDSGDQSDWGGHFVNAQAPDASGILVKSWGKDIYVTEAFIQLKCFEAWAWLNPNARRSDGTAYGGVDLAKMNQALAAVTL